MKNIIKDFTKAELLHIKDASHFTPQEQTLFDLRSDDVTLEQCAELMNMSVKTITRLNKRVMDKIRKSF